MPRIDGIDISAWQVDTDWDQVAASGVKLAIIKATESTGYVSESFHQDWAGARRTMLYRGAYHYMRPNNSVSAQVARFVDTVGALDQPGDLGPVCDAEEAGLTSSTVIDWMERASAATGKLAILYASSSFVESHLGGDPALRRFPLWVAHYTTGAVWVPAPYDSAFLHQWSSSGVVPGVAGRCDVNAILDAQVLNDLSGGLSLSPSALLEDDVLNNDDKVFIQQVIGQVGDNLRNAVASDVRTLLAQQPQPPAAGGDVHVDVEALGAAIGRSLLSQVLGKG